MIFNIEFDWSRVKLEILSEVQSIGRRLGISQVQTEINSKQLGGKYTAYLTT